MQLAVSGLKNMQNRQPILLFNGSVTSLAQLTPTVYSMSSRATMLDVPLIPSNTIC